MLKGALKGEKGVVEKFLPRKEKWFPWITITRRDPRGLVRLAGLSCWSSYNPLNIDFELWDNPKFKDVDLIQILVESEFHVDPSKLAIRNIVQSDLNARIRPKHSHLAAGTLAPLWFSALFFFFFFFCRTCWNFLFSYSLWKPASRDHSVDQEKVWTW